jgi:hypothetical protein
VIMPTSQPVLSVVVPMYDEEEVLPIFFERMHPLLDSLSIPYEVLVVDDGSRDKTAARLREAAESRLHREPLTALLVKAAAGVALAVLASWLLTAHASGDSIVALLRFWVFGLALPGVVVWRLASRVRHNLIEDVAAGSLVGVCLLLLVYVVAAPLGLQRWAWLWSLPVVVAAVAVPTWRERLTVRVERPVNPVTAWLVALACALPLYGIGRSRSLLPEPYTDAGSYSPDLTFHQALAASAKYDFPLAQQHSFWHQFTAATSWATGVDLTDLVYTIGWVPLLLAGTAIIFALTDRLTPRSRWAGPLAIAIAAIGGTVDVYPSASLPAEGPLNYAWAGPTQNLGSALLVLLAVLGIDLLRGGTSRGTWALFVVVAAAASGAKAAVLPLVICGLLLVLVVRLRSHQATTTTAIAAAVAGGLFLASVVVVRSSGLAFKPFLTFAKIGIYPQVAKPLAAGQLDHGAMWVTATTACLALLLGSAGLLVLVGTASRWLRDPGMVFLVGIAVAGFCGMVLLDHPGAGQLSFHRTAVPAIGALAAAGAVWMLVFWLTDKWSELVVAASVLGGAGALAAARAIAKAQSSEGQPFRRPDGSLTGLAAPWLWTIGLLLVVALLVTGLWKLTKRSGRPIKVAATSLVLAAMGAGFFVPVQAMAQDKPVGQPGDQVLGPSQTQADAATWLRDHAAPGEVIATNTDCAGTGCLWIAALSDRPVLLQQHNDIVFMAPTRDTLRRLREEYGVRWLYLDPTLSVVSPALKGLVSQRYKAPDALVYELP